MITSSGALVTLIFALAALVTKPDDFDLPVPVRLILGVVLAAFAAAAVLALITARPGAYHEVTLESLSAAASDKAMGASALEGEPEIARGLVQIISKSREENARKARFLRAAVTFEAVAALMLTVGVSVVLFVG
ncbi:hypothetical protein [Paenarthrobacter nitroguajacolicus]|uniref:hypothetical protein n=1 Tax=Paenarthrobacter nitroguajacolicus TaxID=211146 RepID=UPI0011121692|nr:hypothetical protein [Paenarthrobacter nitroguajacolicus]